MRDIRRVDVVVVCVLTPFVAFLDSAHEVIKGGQRNPEGPEEIELVEDGQSHKVQRSIAGHFIELLMSFVLK